MEENKLYNEVEREKWERREGDSVEILGVMNEWNSNWTVMLAFIDSNSVTNSHEIELNEN